MSVSPEPSGQSEPTPLEADISLVSSGRTPIDLDASLGRQRAYRIHSPLLDGTAVGEDYLILCARALHRRKWTALAITLIACLCVAGYGLFTTPIYETSTTLLIESDKQKAVTFGSVTDQGQTTDDYYQTQYRLLGSRTLAERTLDTLKLWDHAAFNVVREPQASKNDAQAVRSEAITSFLKHLEIAPIRNTRLVEVKFRLADPELAARVANAHAQAYIQQNLESKFAASQDLSTWLTRQLTEQRQKVEESDIAVQKYREQHHTLGLATPQTLVDQRLSDLTSAVTKAKTARIERETVYRQLEAAETDPEALRAFPAILSHPYVQQVTLQLAELQQQRAELSDRLGSRHPDLVKIATAAEAVDAKLQAAISQVAQSIRTDYLGAVEQEERLAEALEAQKGSVLAFNRVAIQGSALSREAESNRQLYEGLLQRTKESGVVGDLRPSNIRIVDPAIVPRSPASPNTTFLFLLAAIGAPLLGVSAVLGLERFNRRLTTRGEILSHLGLPTLGLIPRIRTKIPKPDFLLGDDAPWVFTEAFRTVRTSVLLSPGGHRARTVLVTSTTPREGKTLSASNLAVGFAQIGERVLLVDCDTRRPAIHLMFDVEQEPGLSDLITGRARAKDAIHPGGMTNLWVLPAGHLPSDAAELLGSRAFKEFLVSVDELYDRVVLDSPPVPAVTDATILGHLAGGIVFIVNAETTDPEAAVTAVSRLESAGGELIGVVLNRASLDDRYGYTSYGDYH